MQNLFKILILFVTGICLSATTFYYIQNSGKASEKQAVTKKDTESVVLFAVTGYGSETANVSLDELKKNYASGKVFVLEKSKNTADDFFKAKNTNVLKTIQEFVPKAADNILITDLDNLHVQFKALKINDISFFDNPSKYELTRIGTQKKPFDFKKHITKFMLTGVTAIARATGRVADTNGTPYLTDKLKNFFQDADFVHISNEVSMADDCEYKAGTRFCTKERDFQALLDLNCDIVELTGNHNRDYGKEPFIKTYEWYKKHNIKPFGGGLNLEQANTPLVIKMKDGKTFGFIGFNELCPLGECAKAENEPGANAYDKEKARKVIEKMKKELKVDIVFVSVQFGEIDAYYPSGTQKPICKDLIDFGADVVYGSQAHQVQYVEFYKNKPVFYGMGNFLFDQIHRIGVRQGYFLQNYFYKGRLIQAVPVFTMIDKIRRVAVPATPEEATVIRKEIFKDELLYK
jgi:poly-gamma-glutamate capsule biosynthesis protein CapA/YwtB (metallophosphatase superfamily)